MSDLAYNGLIGHLQNLGLRPYSNNKHEIILKPKHPSMKYFFIKLKIYPSGYDVKAYIKKQYKKQFPSSTSYITKDIQELTQAYINKEISKLKYPT